MILERSLRKKAVSAEVLNMGISGFGTAEELVQLENEGLRYHPDAVVLGFFANDFDDTIKARLFRLNGHELIAVNRQFVPGVVVLDVINSIGVLRWLSENSYLYAFATNTVYETAKRRLLSDAQREFSQSYATGGSGDSGPAARALTQALVERIHNICRSNGIRFYLVDIPQPSKERTFESSIPSDLVSAFRQHSDVLLDSNTLFGPYRGIAEIHVPGGAHHISELAHFLIGSKLAEQMLYDMRASTAHLSNDEPVSNGN